MATQYVQYPQPTLNSGPVQFTLNSGTQTVIQDTSTPANSKPLPVALLNTSGAAFNPATETTLAGITAKLPSTLGQKTAAASMAVVLASDQTLPLPTGAATETTLAAVNTKTPALGQALMAASVPVAIASNQSAIPASQSGTWNITNVSGTVSLPTGAATETTLAGMSAKLPATLGQKAMASALAVSIASDQSAIPASQSGTWTVQPGNTANTTPWLVSARNQDGSGNSVTSAAVGSNRGLHVVPLGRTVVNTARNDYTSTSVTTGAWVQLIASTSAETQEIEIFDSSGQTLELGTGAAASEARLILVFPGGNGRVPVRVAASTRISIRAVSASATSGEISLNFYG